MTRNRTTAYNRKWMPAAMAVLVAGCSSVGSGGGGGGGNYDSAGAPVRDSIRPGRAIEPIALGDTWNDVVTSLGAPDALIPSDEYWAMLFIYDDLGISGSIVDADQDEQADPNERVIVILATSPYDGTYAGVGIGSNTIEVEEAMGPPEDVNAGDWWYPSRGIAWTADMRLITAVFVFESIELEGTNFRTITPSEEQVDTTGERVRILRDELLRDH